MTRMEADAMMAQPQTYLIHYEVPQRGGMRAGLLATDAPFTTEDEAWDFARRFAMASRYRYFNIYVVDHACQPVCRWNERMLNRRQSNRE